MLSKLAVLFTVVAYANAQCGPGGTLVGTNCVCDTGFLCASGNGGAYWGCAAQTDCACGSSSTNKNMYSTPCTSFTTFPSSSYREFYDHDYHCKNATTSVYSTYTDHVCNVPKQSDLPATYNSDCADSCRTWTCTERDGNTPNFCSGSCYDANDQCMTKWGIPSMSPTASPTASSPIEALQAAVAVQSTYLIVLIVGIVVAMICSCLACAAACFSYRKNTDHRHTDRQTYRQTDIPTDRQTDGEEYDNPTSIIKDFNQTHF